MIRSRAGSRRVAALGLRAVALALWLPACAGLSRSELPEEPIAIAYLDPEAARKRSEDLLARDPEVVAADRARRKDGVAPVSEISRQIGSLLGGLVRERREHVGRLALLDPRTAEVQVLRAARLGAVPLDWSPDHRRLLFAQLELEYLQLFEYDHQTGEVRPMTHGPRVHPRGCYASGGRLVTMTVDVVKDQVETRIELTNAGGVNAQRVSTGPRDHSPTCAPDGSAVAWVETPLRGRSWIVSRKPLVGGEPRRLSPGREPSFSPDGKWILYSAPIGREWQLWRIRPDGTGRARVGPGGVEDQKPDVSPDARLVVYVVENDFRRSLHVRRMDGTGDRILFNDGDADRPVW